MATRTQTLQLRQFKMSKISRVGPQAMKCFLFSARLSTFQFFFCSLFCVNKKNYLHTLDTYVEASSRCLGFWHLLSLFQVEMRFALIKTSSPPLAVKNERAPALQWCHCKSHCVNKRASNDNIVNGYWIAVRVSLFNSNSNIGSDPSSTEKGKWN